MMYHSLRRRRLTTSLIGDSAIQLEIQLGTSVRRCSKQQQSESWLNLSQETSTKRSNRHHEPFSYSHLATSKKLGKTKSHTDAKGCKSHKTLLWFLCISTPETKGENPSLDSDVP